MKEKVLSTMCEGRLNKLQKTVLLLFIVVPFTYLISAYSLYYFIPDIDVYSTLLLVLLYSISGNTIKDIKNKRNARHYLFASSLVLLVPTIIHLEAPFVTMVCELLFAFSFLSLKDELKVYIYDKFIRILSWLFLLGIIEYFLAFLGITYSLGEIERHSMSGSDSITFIQGIFVILPSYFSELSFRFMSLCEEPGTVGTLCFFLIVTIDRKKYTKQFMIFTVAGLLSLSLAFYVLSAIWLLLSKRFLKLNWKGIAFIVFVLLLFFHFFGDFFKSRIVERVAGNSISEIDNRSSEGLNKRYEEAWKDGDIYLGMGNRAYFKWEAQAGASGAGLKKFMMQYGLIGTVMLFFLFSRFFLLFNGINKKNLIILFLFWLSFYQRPYWNNVPVFIALFSFSCEYIDYKTKKYVSRTNIDNKGICPAST